MKAREHRNQENVNFMFPHHEVYVAGAAKIRAIFNKAANPRLHAANKMVFSSAGAYRNHMNGGEK